VEDARKVPENQAGVIGVCLLLRAYEHEWCGNCAVLRHIADVSQSKIRSRVAVLARTGETVRDG